MSHSLRLVAFMISVITVFTAVSMSGCGPKHSQPRNEIRQRMSQDVTVLDPSLIVDVDGGVVASKIFNGLVRYNKEMMIIPDLAEKWDVSEDGKTYTFHLRKGVKFHDGSDFDSEDVEASIKRVLTNQVRAWVFDRIVGAPEFRNGEGDLSGLRVIDSHKIELELNAPFAPFTAFLAMPAGYMVPSEKSEDREMSWNPVGTGPFIFKEWRRDEMIVLERNDNYFDAPPSIERMIFRIIPDEFTTIAEFEAGNLDIMAVPDAEFDRYTTESSYKGLVHSIADLNIYYIGINMRKPLFSDIRVRQAINMAVDRKSILKKVDKGRGALAQGSIPPGLPGFDADRAPYPYDPERAKELLKAAGYPDGIEFNLYHRPTQRAAQLMAAMQDSMLKAGIKANIRTLEWTALKTAVVEGETDLFFMSWVADYPDGENFLAPVFHSANHGAAGNRAFYSNPKVDELIEIAQKEPDEAQRAKMYKEIDSIIFAEAPWVFLWHGESYTVVQPWVKGWTPGLIYNADKGLNIDIEGAS